VSSIGTPPLSREQAFVLRRFSASIVADGTEFGFTHSAAGHLLRDRDGLLERIRSVEPLRRLGAVRRRTGVGSPGGGGTE
jgi:hypothetical protein